MNLTWTIIIAVLYLIVHVIAAIAKEAARRKEEQLKREEAARRRGEAGVLGTASDSTATFDPTGTTGQPGGQPTQPPASTMRRGSPKEDLAARRREQIEQLRNRRQVRQGLPAGGGRQMPSPTMQVPDRSATPEGVEQEARRRQEIEETKARQGRQARARQREIETKSRQERERRERAFREAVPENSPAAPPPPIATDPMAMMRAQQTRFRSHLKAQLLSPASIRDVFILKEILDRPVTMRDSGRT